MSNAAFDLLTGCVRLDVARPAELANGLADFYKDPNNAVWGGALCRTLYHESVHFWQMLASAYLGNMVAAEWQRVETFRDRGEIPVPSNASIAFRRRAEGAPFSAYELCECWARYWDVHTRSPNNILEEEGLHVLVRRHSVGYADESFDALMRTGVESSRYEAPYRWMLERVEQADWAARLGDSSRVASYLVALIFPLTVHAAFGSPDPVGVTCAVIQRLVEREDLARQFFARKTSSINLDWLTSWQFCHEELVGPVLRDMRLPNFTSGLDVIDRGPLRRHPFFPAYLARNEVLRGYIKLNFLARDNIRTTAQNLYDLHYRTAIVEASYDDPWIVFGLPGQPAYRHLLGMTMHAPRVTFSNAASLAGETLLSKLRKRSGDEASSVELGEIPLASIEELEGLLRRFRAAEYATSRGLRVEAFENS